MLKYIYVKQTKSCIRKSKQNKLLIKSLGLKKINHKILLRNNKIVKNIIFKVQHMISVYIIDL